MPKSQVAVRIVVLLNLWSSLQGGEDPVAPLFGVSR